LFNSFHNEDHYLAINLKAILNFILGLVKLLVIEQVKEQVTKRGLESFILLRVLLEASMQIIDSFLILFISFMRTQNYFLINLIA